MNTIRLVGIDIAKPVFQPTSGLMMILLHRIETPHAPNAGYRSTIRVRSTICYGGMFTSRSGE